MTDYRSVYHLKKVEAGRESTFDRNPQTRVTYDMVTHINFKYKSTWTPSVWVGDTIREVQLHSPQLAERLRATYTEVAYHAHNSWLDAREKYLSAEDSHTADLALDAMLQHVTLDYPKLEEDAHPAADADDSMLVAMSLGSFVAVGMGFAIAVTVGTLPGLLVLGATILLVCYAFKRMFRRNHG